MSGFANSAVPAGIIRGHTPAFMSQSNIPELIPAVKLPMLHSETNFFANKRTGVGYPRTEIRDVVELACIYANVTKLARIGKLIISRHT